MNKVAKQVIALADTYVAHITIDDRPALTFGDLDKAIDHTGEVFQLRRAGHLRQLRAHSGGAGVAVHLLRAALQPGALGRGLNSY
jgi:hypothetical protein